MSILTHTKVLWDKNLPIRETWSQVLLLLSCDFVIIKSIQRGGILGLDSLFGSKTRQFCGTVNYSKKVCIHVLESVFRPNSSLPAHFQERPAHVCGLTDHSLTLALGLCASRLFQNKLLGAASAGVWGHGKKCLMFRS